MKTVSEEQKIAIKKRVVFGKKWTNIWRKLLQREITTKCRYREYKRITKNAASNSWCRSTLDRDRMIIWMSSERPFKYQTVSELCLPPAGLESMSRIGQDDIRAPRHIHATNSIMHLSINPSIPASHGTTSNRARPPLSQGPNLLLNPHFYFWPWSCSL